jgi:hypothetical protein
MLAESFKAVQQVDRMILIQGNPGGFKPGELLVFKASRQTGKSMLNQTDWFDWTDPPDGLTDEETGPV